MFRLKLNVFVIIWLPVSTRNLLCFSWLPSHAQCADELIVNYDTDGGAAEESSADSPSSRATWVEGAFGRQVSFFAKGD